MIELRWSNPLCGRIGSFRLLPNYCGVNLGAGGCYSVFVSRHTRPKVHYWNMMRKVWTHLFKVVRHGGCQKRSVEIPRGNLALAIHDVLFWLWWVFELLASNNNNNNNNRAFFGTIILGINLYLFLKFEVYYFTSLYHFNGCIVYDKNDHILSANIHRTRISSILIFFSRICHYLSEIQVSHRIQFQKNKNIDHHIEINSKKNSGSVSRILKYVA